MINGIQSIINKCTDLTDRFVRWIRSFWEKPVKTDHISLKCRVAEFIINDGIKNTVSGKWHFSWSCLPEGMMSPTEWERNLQDLVSYIQGDERVYLAKAGAGTIILDLWEQYCPNVPKREINENPDDLKELIDFIVETGTSETQSGQFFLDYDVMNQFFPEQEFKTLFPKLLEGLKNREQVIGVEVCDDDRCIIDIQFAGKYCPNYEKLEGEE